MKPKKTASGIRVYCSHDKIVRIDELVPNPQNPNQHPDEQIELLAKIIQSNGWRNAITVSNLSGMIVKGHGRYAAAQLAGLDKAPVDYQDYESRDDEIKDLIADNKIAELSEVDMQLAAELIESTDTYNPDISFDLSDFGCTAEEITEYFYDNRGRQEDKKYTRNIEAPLYTPKGDKPEIQDLLDDSKTIKLIDDIRNANLPDDIERFLITAARRHTVFNYGLIAEYYAHSDKETQALFEDSGLVIIDFNRAIELGYIRLSKEIASQYGAEHGNE